MTFNLSKEEELKVEEVRKIHKKCKGTFSYIFTPTGIGFGVEIRCNECGEVLDITDYSNW